MKKTDHYYLLNIKQWLLITKLYDGGPEIIKNNLLKRSEQRKMQEEANRVEEMVENHQRNVFKHSDSITSNPTNRSDKPMYKSQSHGYQHVKKQRSKDGGGRQDAPRTYLSISEINKRKDSDRDLSVIKSQNMYDSDSQDSSDGLHR